mgnify:FL=1
MKFGGICVKDHDSVYFTFQAVNYECNDEFLLNDFATNTDLWQIII